MRIKLLFIILIFLDATYAQVPHAQITIHEDVVKFPMISFYTYTIENHSPEIYYSWIRENKRLSYGQEIKYHFFKQHDDFSLFNLIVDADSYESNICNTTTGNLIIQIIPGKSFTYVFPMHIEHINDWIFLSREHDIYEIIQSIIPERLIYKSDAYIVIQ